VTDATSNSQIPVPEQGQLVRVRQRHYIVQDVLGGSVEPSRPDQHRVRLECLDDDQVGRTLDVIWQHEVNPVVHDQLGLPRPDAWDPRDRFDAFLHATRWSLSSVLEGLPLQAPFRGAIQIEDYQLEPVVRALRMPRVNLLIADDVGLGKTIEAGMVMQELLARQRIRRILIVCPASLQKQWAEEMLFKFALKFEVVDRAYMQRLRKEYGSHVNAWASFPRLITSMDFLKREAPLEGFLKSLKKERTGGLRDWDLLVVDEVHNVAPSGRKSYIRDSDRTDMMRQILSHFEHRLFLTATPHNGFTESFTALLEMLDPLRFSRGSTFNKAHLDAVMVRRLKDDMIDDLGNRRFPERKVEALPTVKLTGPERELFDGLDAYMSKRLGRVKGFDRLPVQFALTLLKKRLLSSPLAFLNSITVHQTHLAPDTEPGQENVGVVASLQDRLAEDFADDEEKDRTEETALAESTGFFAVTPEERQLVEKLRDRAQDVAEKPDSKVAVLLQWIEEHLFTSGAWNNERLLIFTEYKHTLEYLTRALEARGWNDQVITMFGGMPDGRRGPLDTKLPPRNTREGVKAAFRAPPEQEPVRILVATDTASEGLNLQDYCRYLIHWEIPWNPNKMEQRNGRIDRHGQRATVVYCQHFVYDGWEDQQFLDVVVDKVRTQRADLGSVGDVIAAQVEAALRGELKQIKTPEDRRKRLKAEVQAEVVTQDRIRALSHELTHARKVWNLYPDTLKQVLHEGLLLAGHEQGLELADTGERAGKTWLLRNLPATWAECLPFIRDAKGHLLKLVFDDELARDRKDLALIHLDHPLMKRALAVFRANMWSAGLHEEHRLARACYRVAKDVRHAVVAVVARLVCISEQGQKLHEELIIAGGEVQESKLTAADPKWLGEVLELPAKHPKLPAAVGTSLRKLFPAHEATLQKAIDDLAKARDKDLKKQLADRGLAEAREVRGLIDERLKEVDKRIVQMEKEVDDRQLALWDDFEKDQHKKDLDWLRGRKRQLQANRESEPEAVKARYRLRDKSRAFPLALVYVLPEKLLAASMC
jgi:hypothetical protein